MLMKKILRVFLVFSLMLVSGYYVGVTLVDAHLMGLATPEFDFHVEKENYMLPVAVRVDMQTDFKCSAFSCAYVMRHWGNEAYGDSIYGEIPYKMADGYVYPKGILSYLRDNGYEVGYHIGNLAALKNEIYGGHPAIVMIRIRPDRDWLHYVPVVGYTTDSIYVAESISELCNSYGHSHTRSIATAEFERLWNTSAFRMPLYRNTFITAHRR